SGRVFWFCDGTEAGTVQLCDIYPNGPHSFPTGMIAYNNEVYFAATDGYTNHGRELWKFGEPTNELKDLSKPIQAFFYPNPTQDVLQISVPDSKESYSLILQDLQGKTLKTVNNSPLSFDLSEFSAGTYLLSIHSKEGQIALERVVKK
ncbi:MAG: T9SS type A sorting domain-containing protein, partial [Crocinitomicaceae bacterium]|nr:T9SS type A sorting domain-containing protein [Crocinitomicaceae bacterium]